MTPLSRKWCPPLVQGPGTQLAINRASFTTRKVLHILYLLICTDNFYYVVLLWAPSYVNLLNFLELLDRSALNEAVCVIQQTVDHARLAIFEVRASQISSLQPAM